MLESAVFELGDKQHVEGANYIISVSGKQHAKRGASSMCILRQFRLAGTSDESWNNPNENGIEFSDDGCTITLDWTAQIPSFLNGILEVLKNAKNEEPADLRLANEFMAKCQGADVRQAQLEGMFPCNRPRTFKRQEMIPLPRPGLSLGDGAVVKFSQPNEHTYIVHLILTPLTTRFDTKSRIYSQVFSLWHFLMGTLLYFAGLTFCLYIELNKAFIRC